MQIRVYYEDTDLGGVVYYANYLKFIERARSETFFSIGASPIVEGGAFVVRSVTAEYLKPARFGDLLEIKSVCTELRGATLTMRQEIFRDDEKLFSADVRLAFVRNEKPTRIPKDVAKIFDTQKADQH